MTDDTPEHDRERPIVPQYAHDAAFATLVPTPIEYHFVDMGQEPWRAVVVRMGHAGWVLAAINNTVAIFWRPLHRVAPNLSDASHYPGGREIVR